jgi:hypothetical protein
MIVKFKSAASSDRLKELLWVWDSADPDSLLVYRIRQEGSQIRLDVLRKLDFEIAKASRVRWNGSVLSFELFWPSTRCRTWNKITYVDSESAVNEFSYRRIWTNSEPSKAIPNSKAAPRWTRLIGVWQNEDECNLSFNIRISIDGIPRIKIRNELWDETWTAKNVTLDSKGLGFDVYTPRGKWISHVQMASLSRRRVVVETTEQEKLRCLGRIAD